MYYLYMNDLYKLKLKKIICLMSKPGGVPKKILSRFGTPWPVLEKSLKRCEISYVEYGGNFTLSTSKKEAFEIVDEYENSLLAKKYDLNSIAEKMKQHPLSQKEIIKELRCKSNDYLNIITYMTHNFLIYEEDDGRVGLLPWLF